MPHSVNIPYTVAVRIAVTPFGPQLISVVVPCVHIVIGSLHVGC